MGPRTAHGLCVCVSLSFTGERISTARAVLVEANLPQGFKQHIKELVRATALIKGGRSLGQWQSDLSNHYYTNPLTLTLPNPNPNPNSP